MTLFEKILENRGLLTKEQQRVFLNPDYNQTKHDPFLFSDMKKALKRLKKALKNREKIVIYGDYDIDGLSATTLLLDAFSKFGFLVEAFIPSRFDEGYGMTKSAVDKVKRIGADLIVTVDCGSLSHKEIEYATSLGIDTIVTDHHNVAETLPLAVAVINPKIPGTEYPFIDLAGVGVAFKLVQAMQTEMAGLPNGHEKWLLDLVALGTVCDIVSLENENRTNVFWGLRVLAKTRRKGLRALMAVAQVEPENVSARHLGFGLGPRMNASGRLETAEIALSMLRSEDELKALEKAERLNALNIQRRDIQNKIFEEAAVQAASCQKDDVLVVSAQGWNKGVIGIVASKLVDKFKKPTFVFSEEDDIATASARSFGDFSAADAVNNATDFIIKGGGHKAAAGVTLKTENIVRFRKEVNKFYASLNLKNQEHFLLPKEDVTVKDFAEIDDKLVEDISKMEPFGNGNPEPVIKVTNVMIVTTKRMGQDSQHLKIDVKDGPGRMMSFLKFNVGREFNPRIGDVVDIWFSPTINHWQGQKTVEGKLLHIELVDKSLEPYGLL